MAEVRSEPVVLRTARILLRPLTVADRDAFVELHLDPRVSSVVGSYDGPGAVRRLERFEQQWDARGYGMFAMLLPDAGLVGRCGFVFWPDRGPQGAGETEIGWVLDPRHWGRGLATEAASAVLDWGFGSGPGHPGLTHVTAMIAPDNDRSIAIALRLGLRPERDEDFNGKRVRVYTVNRDGWPPGSTMLLSPAVPVRTWSHKPTPGRSQNPRPNR